MSNMFDTRIVAGPASGQPSQTSRLRGLAVTGSVATLAAMVATTLAAALAQAVGVDFEVPDGGETIPLSGFAAVTGFFSIVGVLISLALVRWSARPAERFVWMAVSLTAISLVPPLLSGANTATITALLGLHLVAATVMICTLRGASAPGRIDEHGRMGSARRRGVASSVFPRECTWTRRGAPRAHRISNLYAAIAGRSEVSWPRPIVHTRRPTRQFLLRSEPRSVEGRPLANL